MGGLILLDNGTFQRTHTWLRKRKTCKRASAQLSGDRRSTEALHD